MSDFSNLFRFIISTGSNGWDSVLFWKLRYGIELGNSDCVAIATGDVVNCSPLFDMFFFRLILVC